LTYLDNSDDENEYDMAVEMPLDVRKLVLEFSIVPQDLVYLLNTRLGSHLGSTSGGIQDISLRSRRFEVRALVRISDLHLLILNILQILCFTHR
jgi:hypothetical protein